MGRKAIARLMKLNDLFMSDGRKAKKAKKTIDMQ
jgi:hypothetical protein